MNRWTFTMILWVILAGSGHTQTCMGLDAGRAELTPIHLSKLLDDRTGIQYGGDKFTITSENYELSNDPDPATMAGIRFLVFKKEPDLNGWITPQELVDHPDIVKVDGSPLLAGSDESGTINISQRAPWELPFNQHVPVRLWFVPITVHHVNAVDFESAFEDSCVHVNGENPVSIYFIRTIKLELDLNYWDRETNEVIIPVSGGLPEIDPGQFQYEMEISVCGSDIKIPLEKRGFNLFVFKMDSLFGKYDILTTDGFSPFYLIQCIPITKPRVRLTIPRIDVYEGDEFCLPVRVRDFWGIDSFAFRLQWDERVIEFTGFGPPGNIHSELKKGSGPVFHRLSGRKGGRFTWETKGDPVSIPDGEVLFNLCFRAVGDPGSRSPVDTLGDDHRFYGGELFLGPIVEAGEVRIIPEDYIGFSYETLSCPGTSGPVDVVMNITGKHPPFTLTFDPADTEERIMSGNVDTLWGIPQGTYDITVTDARGNQITKINQEFSVGFPGDFRVMVDSVRSHDPLCQGEVNGEILVQVQQTKDLDFSLFYQKGNDTIRTENALIKGLEAGEYAIWAVDQRGCTAHLPEPMLLNDPAPPVLSQTSIRLECGVADTMIRFDHLVAGGTGVIHYALGNDTVYKRLNQDTLLQEGDYVMHTRDFLGCEATTSFSVETGASDVRFEFDHPGDTLFVAPNESVELTADLLTSDPDLLYDWSASGGSVEDFVQNAARFTFQEAGYIRLTVTDTYGCEYSDQLPVALKKQDEEPGGNDGEEEEEEEEECTVSIPNAITPNGDGINDYLEVFSNCAIKVVLIRIFDKWGGELYRIEGSQVEANFWENLPPGVVLVQVTYEIDPVGDEPAGKKETLSGTVLVIK